MQEFYHLDLSLINANSFIGENFIVFLQVKKLIV